MLKKMKVFKCFTWMGAFGCGSPKGTFLWSSRQGVANFSRNLPNKEWVADMTTKTTRADGTVSISGSTDLKKSQAYTREFGLSTVSIWQNEPKVKPLCLDKVVVPSLWGALSSKDQWRDADLNGVVQHLATGQV